MASLKSNFVKIRSTPQYPLDSSMLGKDGVSLTSFVVNLYLDHLATEVRGALEYFERRLQLHGVELTLDENSNEGVQVDPRVKAFSSQAPGQGQVQDPLCPSLPSGSQLVPATPRDPQCSFDSSLTLPEAYSTPTGSSLLPGAQSGVGALLFLFVALAFEELFTLYYF